MLKCSYKILFLLVGLSHAQLLDMEFNAINSRTTFIDKMQHSLIIEGDDISPICKAHLKEYVQGLSSKKYWALKSAKIPSGLLEGNIVELGSFDECLKIKEDFNTTEIILGKYCLGTIPIDVTLNLLKENFELKTKFDKGFEINIQLATCLPHLCSAIEIQSVYQHLGIGMYFNEKSCQTKISQPELNTGGIITLSFLGFIFLIMLSSTVYDVALFYLEKSPIHPLLIAFSVLTNGRKLITTSNSSSQILCLHGIRVISTMWVILGHRYKIQFKYPVKNYFYLLTWIKDDANMILMNATVSVDTFLLMAGLVISHMFMSTVAKGTRFNIILYYIHRYLRLTPAFAVIILIHVTLLQHLGSGPLWPNSIKSLLVDSCEKYWWKALLYIQNYWRRDGTCVPQSWYLCVDTQLFLLSPMLLIPLNKWPKVTLLATGFLAICSIITSFLTGWFFELNANIIGNPNKDKLENYMKYYYVATHTRAAPWLIGIILGYFIFQVKQTKQKIHLNKLIVLSLWVASLASLCACLFSGNNLLYGEYHQDRLRNSLYMALQRPIWAIALGWIIFACVSGFGGPVNWFLSLPVFQVVSKFTYSLYLVHYTAIFITTAQMKTTPIINNAKEMYIFWGDLAFTFVFAVILTLAFESPIITIEKFIFGPVESKKRKTSSRLDNNSKHVENA